MRQGMATEFNIVPGIGALPLKFGMGPELVETIIGSPDVRVEPDRRNPDWMTCHYNDLDLLLGFQHDDGLDWRLKSIGFGPEGPVNYDGVPFFEEPMRCLALMINESRKVSESSGILDFDDLGISIGDMNIKSEFAIRVFPVGEV